MVFDELSNAFFRFPLRCAGAELVGGRRDAPPPRRCEGGAEHRRGAG